MLFKIATRCRIVSYPKLVSCMSKLLNADDATLGRGAGTPDSFAFCGVLGRSDLQLPVQGSYTLHDRCQHTSEAKVMPTLKTSLEEKAGLTYFVP
ncbi:hypothetical protein VTP01DRAFT_6068 [Rhizomucor pusillus]|uniref:uncharacterized protein n=1 Tax=Rhizomucor pusillus TaxID=4840 RepID=UPI003741F1F3